MEDGDYDYLFKVVLVGDSGVGKSSLLKQFTEKAFLPDLRTTVGVEFSVHEMTIDEKKIRTQIWDTAGQERYRAITNLYYRKANGVILAYDITAHPSFRGLSRWLEEAKSHVEKDSIVMLVGNKIDLKHLRAVDRIEAQKYAEKHQLSFIETSASESINVEWAFESIIRDMYHAALFREDSTQQNSQHLETISNISKSKQDDKPRSKCC
eukprot:GFUD01082587.1.p1 GENE.GFUD01082587.1~~GFUD01082587.1.p1  ORF type:complete len:209 (-),score=49.78 GFUD01082587.1:203-829(-)